MHNIKSVIVTIIVCTIAVLGFFVAMKYVPTYYCGACGAPWSGQPLYVLSDDGSEWIAVCGDCYHIINENRD